MYCTKTWQGRFKDCGKPHDQQKYYRLYSRRIGSCGKTVLEKELKKLDIKKEVPVVAEYNFSCPTGISKDTKESIGYLRVEVQMGYQYRNWLSQS